MSAELIMYTGLVGLILGILFLFIFLIKRISRFVSRFSSVPKRKRKGFGKSLIMLLLIFLWITSFSILFYVGLFLKAYFNFTKETQIAEIYVDPLPYGKSSKITLKEHREENELPPRTFVIRGDQWMVEGDILKWDPWLNFFGLETRYRLTRIQGRHVITKDELSQTKTAYSLVEDEDNPMWSYFYTNYHKLPFVDAAYGNAVFQYSDKKDTFYVYVSNSGFTTKRK